MLWILIFFTLNINFFIFVDYKKTLVYNHFEYKVIEHNADGTISEKPLTLDDLNESRPDLDIVRLEQFLG